MKIIFQLLGLYSFIFTSASIASSSWVLDKSIDRLTDQKIITATSTYKTGITWRDVVVQCENKKLKVYFGFGEFLNSNLVSVKYRVDKQAMIEDKWFPSAKGTAVFATESSDMARLLLNGNTFVIEVSNYRGQPYRASYNLVGAKRIIGTVLQQCGISENGMEQKVVGLRREIGIDLERWGPKNISTSKMILAALGVYDGPQDSVMEPDFALAIQRFYDKYIEDCSVKKVSDEYCSTAFNYGKSGEKPTMPHVSFSIYKSAPMVLKEIAGKLRTGE